MNLTAIETALRQHASVRECVVLPCETIDKYNSGSMIAQEFDIHRNIPVAARRHSKYHPQLIAYIVPTEAGIKVGELRRYIKTVCPSVTMPAKFIFQRTLPSTSDRTCESEMPMPSPLAKSALAKVSATPRRQSEQLIANIWQEILHLKHVGAHDNFFDLVRDSSLAMEIILRIRKVFAVSLSVRALFADPTVAGMAVAVLQHKGRRITKSEESTRLLKIRAKE
jgi:acyl carrier protein